MFRSFLMFAAISLGAPGCEIEEPKPPVPPLVDAGIEPELAQRIEAVKTEILSDKCFLEQQDVSVCDWGDFPFDPAQFAMNQNTGETILIVDDFPTLPPRAIRYKNRIKGYFRVDSGGTLSPVPFVWRAPTRLFHALSEFASPDFIPAEALRSLKDPLYTTYGFYADESAGHGSYVFSLLVDANPYQPIVVLDTPTFPRFAREEYCDTSGTAASIDRLRAKSQHMADELRQRMSELNVRFVNASFGYTLDTVRDSWTRTCGGALPGDDLLRAKLNAYSPIMDALFNTPGVFGSHASIDAPDPNDFPFDYPSEAYPNRLLAGYFTTLESTLDAEGRGNHSGINGWPGRKNVDIYLNSGVLPLRPFKHNTTPLLQVDEFGILHMHISFTTTSWIAPLALSRFIHIRNSMFSQYEMSNELISTIRSKMVPDGCNDLPEGRCIYQDPLKHGQIEAVRLGYRPLEYVQPEPQQ